MSKRRKGVSLEEKRERILRIYHESKDVFNLKEVEKLGAKAGVGTSRSASKKKRNKRTLYYRGGSFTSPLYGKAQALLTPEKSLCL